jgi:hypothetical protein
MMYDAVPLGALLALSGRLVGPRVARREIEADDLLACLGVADFGVLAEVLHEDHFVAGIETMHMIRKGQLGGPKGKPRPQ